MKGIVVDQKESGVRFAIHQENHDPATQTYVRDLYPWETVLAYRPKQKNSAGEYVEDTHELPASDEDNSLEADEEASLPPQEEAKTPSAPKPGQTVRKD